MNDRAKIVLEILAAIATIIGLCIALIALIPAFGQWLFPIINKPTASNVFSTPTAALSTNIPIPTSTNPLAETPDAISTDIATTDISTEIPTFTPQPTNTNVPPTPASTSTNIPSTPSPYIKGHETFGAYPATPIAYRPITLGEGELYIGTAVRFAARAYGCNTIDMNENIPYTVFLIRGPIQLNIEIDNGGWDDWVNVYDDNFAKSLLQPKIDEVGQHPNYPTVGYVECIIPPTSMPVSTSTNISTTSSANHYFQMGLADYQSQRYDDAITNLNSCVQLDSSFSDCYNILGMAYRQKNDYVQAILNHNKAIAFDPRYDYYFERGVTYHQKSVFTKPAEYDKAISDFKSCLELNPTFSNCLNRLGMVYRDSGNLAQALIYHNQAIELSPERADFYWERGITYQKMGDTGKANADFQKARDLGYGN